MISSAPTPARPAPVVTDTAVVADTAQATRAPHRLPRLRVLILALLLGLVAPFLAVATPAQAAAPVKARTAYEHSIQNSVLSLINQQRRAHGLKALKMNKRLKVSARRHNAAMSRANTMSHTVRGEARLSRRISRAGYNWGRVAENIAWNSQVSRGGVLVLQKLMYNERAPYDGHRRNILNRSYREVGVDVYVDRAHHKIWLTTDFGRKR